MPLPHSLFGSQVHETGKRHWWQRHPLPPKVRRVFKRHPKPTPKPGSEEAVRDLAHGDTFDRENTDVSNRQPTGRARELEQPRAPTPKPSRSSSPPRPAAAYALVPDILANGHRDAIAEERLLAHFEDKGFGPAVEVLRGVHPTVVLHVADAAFAAGDHDAALKLYALAHRKTTNSARVPKHLQRRAGKAAERKDAVAQRVYLRAWIAAQPNTLQSLSWVCLQAGVLNPEITRNWYLRAVKLAKKENDQAGLDTLSHTLLRSLAYAIVINGAAADASLLHSIQTKDPQLLSWAASGVRAAGNLELADGLERRAQELSAS
jgi:hypothetical protein